MYTLINGGCIKKTEDSRKKDALIALGYVLIPDEKPKEEVADENGGKRSKARKAKATSET